MAVAIRNIASAGNPGEDHRELYSQVCQSYRAIDDFRMKLLGLLPIATGAGVLALLSSGKVDLNADSADAAQTQQILIGVAVFGIAITLGLFAYELHGIKKCGRLIKIGARIERDMGSSGGYFGQFATRPHRVGRVIDVPLASCLVYPASLAVWVFVGLVSVSGWFAVTASGLVMVGLFAGSVWGCRRLDRNLAAWDRAQGLLHARQRRKVEPVSEIEARALTVELFLAAMSLVDNPGMVRFGPRSDQHRGWAIDMSQRHHDAATAGESRAEALYLCSDGAWWSCSNGVPKPAEQPAAGRIEATLAGVLDTHELHWPSAEIHLDSRA
jgi:hypothetical protein